MGIFFICVIALANLRGVRESGALFALPTYGFIACYFLLIVMGLMKYFSGETAPLPTAAQVPSGELQSLSVFLILRAFASGCAALTGVEAISNGIPAFRAPESRNAARTLTIMAAILTSVFLGMTLLAYLFHAQPVIEGVSHGHVTTVKESLNSVLAKHVFGRGPLYFVVQLATALILILAANTSFADFPRLSSLLARDGLAPRQLANLGDRLVFQNGILLLGFFAALLLVLFKAEVNHLIPLYALGVFLSFTLSQAGMVKRWLTQREPGWKTSVVINGIGAAATGVVLCVIVSVKFTQGAWMVAVVLAVLVFCFFKVRAHYHEVDEALSMDGYHNPRTVRHRVLLLIPSVNRGVMSALKYAQTISENIEAVHVELDPRRSRDVREAWQRWGGGIPLRILRSPWRSMTEPILDYIDLLIREEKLDYVTVMIEEFVTTKWWHRLLHNSTGLMLKFALLFKPQVVVVNVRYHVG